MTNHPHLAEYYSTATKTRKIDLLEKELGRIITEAVAKQARKVESYGSDGNHKAKNLLKELADCLPSARNTLKGLRPSATEDLCQDPQGMAEIAKEPWGKLWKKKRTKLRAKDWLKFYKKVIPAALKPNLPNVDDAEEVIAGSNDSTPGPDGIPFGAYRATRETFAPLLTELFTTLMAPAQRHAPPLASTMASFFSCPNQDRAPRYPPHHSHQLCEQADSEAGSQSDYPGGSIPHRAQSERVRPGPPRRR